MSMEHRFDWIGRLLLDMSPDLCVAKAQSIGESVLILTGYFLGDEFQFTGVRAVWVDHQAESVTIGLAATVLAVGQRAGRNAA